MQTDTSTRIASPPQAVSGADIIAMAQDASLQPRLLYEAVIDLSRDGLLTANCINMAAGILLKDLGLPNYFFTNIQKESLVQLLQSIASNIRVIDGKADLYGRVADIDFDLSYGEKSQKVRIATAETRDSMEKVLEKLISGHRREYYYSPESGYYTYIIRPETTKDFDKGDFKNSRFLFNLAGDYGWTPAPTRKRYEKYLEESDKSATPLIKVYNLPETGETRLMFKSDFDSTKLHILRKIFLDRGFILGRAYWEPYCCDDSVSSSVCSMYIRGELTRRDEEMLVADLTNFLSFALSPVTALYLDGTISLSEMLFAGNCIDFTHLFIFKESENIMDREILSDLTDKDHQEAFARRIQDSNKSTYSATIIEQTALKNPDLLRELYTLFAAKFDPEYDKRPTAEDVEKSWVRFESKIRSRFIDFALGYEIFSFMFKMVSCTLKTNFFKTVKRSFSFRFDNRILDPLVFSQFVYGIFLVNGHYACGTHLRAQDIARGGLRLIRVTGSNHSRELDNAVLLNYALGPKAQRIKHKDICESGSKGVVVPHPPYANYGGEALCDYTEGIMDLMLLPDPEIVDYYGRPEMVFFGPDEGTAQLMDSVASRARQRGYRHWRTITTGKSSGIPHDTYGILSSGEVFGLYGRDEKGVELQINGVSVITTTDMEDIHAAIGNDIVLSGMTTTSVMSSFRTLIDYKGLPEEDLNLMITGGPDGDLGANQIQCYRGNICLIIDGGSILFDPDGLDRKELRKLAFSRHTNPRRNSLGYPVEKLGPRGFRVPLGAKDVVLPDGSTVQDGTLFHRFFLTDPGNRKFLAEANIKAFIPCGGFKDTINQGNVKNFINNFKELQFIVEGANVFFDDSARRYIATTTPILQIKDTSANKGGVFSSSIAEVLTAFLLGDDYEEKLLNDARMRKGLILNVMQLVRQYGQQETKMLLKLHEAGENRPLFQLSEQSSEQIFAFQDTLKENLQVITGDRELLSGTLNQYIPTVLVERLGMDSIIGILQREELQTYLEAILSKKLASMAFYQFGHDWESFLAHFHDNMSGSLAAVLSAGRKNS
jgi:glutamate dehydrogenase